MDAVEFLKVLGKMCDGNCRECEFEKVHSVNEGCSTWRTAHPEEAVAIAEKWAAEHPIKTRQSVFLKQWPDARINDVDGVLEIQPCKLNRDMSATCQCTPCVVCRKAFWLAEVENAEAK